MTYIVSEYTKNIRKMDSTYITECGYKGPASQPANQSASQPASQPASQTD